MEKEKFIQIANLVRYWILTSTNKAGSGHPTSSLSATDLMIVLMFGGFFKFNPKSPKYVSNDRLIFSKGHASPLFYSLWAVAGQLSPKELMKLRRFNSNLEGHPTMRFPFTEAATGSLGQGLSIGLGMALNAKYFDKLNCQTFVLLGDSEMAEGSVWESIQLATYYKLNNLVGILDVNRLGQRGQTMYGHKVKEYADRIGSFGWEVITIDGHNIEKITEAYELAIKSNKPTMIIAKTIKGKGIKFLEDKENWHGKTLNNKELKRAIKGLDKVNTRIRASLAIPERINIKILPSKKIHSNIKISSDIATREAFGRALVRIFPKFPQILVLDAETSNSTYADIFKNKYPKNFFEMFIAEQNMVGTAIGLSISGKIPFVSTFAAFFTRSFDQIRMSQYSYANIKFIGSHCGVSIGPDGTSQMGLEDIAMFRSIQGSTIFYPADPVCTDKLVEIMASKKGIFYLRTTRSKTPTIYDKNTEFKIGGSNVVYQSAKDKVTVVAAGIILHEAIAAYKELKKKKINIRVIDLYSIKPLDKQTLIKAANETKGIIVVEDHYPEGGICEAVRTALADTRVKIKSLAVTKMPRSGTSGELLNFESIDKSAIINAIKSIK